MNNLGCYCNAFSYYISVTKQLKKENKVIKKPTQNGEILVKNPLCDLQKMYSEEMRKFASMCGLTIDSRLKAATIAREGIDNEINDEFGDIMTVKNRLIRYATDCISGNIISCKKHKQACSRFLRDE